jgi:Flp pilus assembly protein TadG
MVVDRNEGVAGVEFALCAITLALMAVAALEFGMGFYRKMQVYDAAQAGAAGAGGGAQNQQALQQRASTLQLLTIDAEHKLQNLTSGILTNVTITSNSRANTLIVNAPRDSMPLIEALGTSRRMRSTSRPSLKGGMTM